MRGLWLGLVCSCYCIVLLFHLLDRKWLKDNDHGVLNACIYMQHKIFQHC